jgi:hypothetical protein
MQRVVGFNLTKLKEISWHLLIAAITDIIATTIQSRSGVLADNLTQNNAILQRLSSKGNVRPFSGGRNS